jgi:hypothetical protein
MTEVVVSKQIGVNAKNAWEKLSSFKGIEEFSPIATSVTTGEGEGAKRVCTMPDGATINEVLSKVDTDNMEFQYKITEGPFPITGYLSTVKVEAIGDSSCKVTWGCEFDSVPEAKEEMVKLFEGFYNVIIDSLETLIKNQN